MLVCSELLCSIRFVSTMKIYLAKRQNVIVPICLSLAFSLLLPTLLGKVCPPSCLPYSSGLPDPRCPPWQWAPWRGWPGPPGCLPWPGRWWTCGISALSASWTSGWLLSDWCLPGGWERLCRVWECCEARKLSSRCPGCHIWIFHPLTFSSGETATEGERGLLSTEPAETPCTCGT